MYKYTVPKQHDVYTSINKTPIWRQPCFYSSPACFFVPHSPMVMSILQLLVIILSLLVLVIVHVNSTTLYNTSRTVTNRELLSNGCNLFRGKWVFDASYPLYESKGCPFIDPEFDCIKYGRPDKQFLKFSWKPDSCNVPRYYGL